MKTLTLTTLALPTLALTLPLNILQPLTPHPRPTYVGFYPPPGHFTAPSPPTSPKIRRAPELIEPSFTLNPLPTSKSSGDEKTWADEQVATLEDEGLEYGEDGEVRKSEGKGEADVLGGYIGPRSIFPSGLRTFLEEVGAPKNGNVGKQDIILGDESSSNGVETDDIIKELDGIVTRHRSNTTTSEHNGSNTSSKPKSNSALMDSLLDRLGCILLVMCILVFGGITIGAIGVAVSAAMKFVKERREAGNISLSTARRATLCTRTNFSKPLNEEAVGAGKRYSKHLGYETVRYPLSGLVGTLKDRIATEVHNKAYPNSHKNVEILNANVANWLDGKVDIPDDNEHTHMPDPYSIFSRFKICLDAPNYTVFSNTTSQDAWITEHAVGGFHQKGKHGYNANPIRGANGDMGDNETASFDPILFFHHCFIDYVFSLWQTEMGLEKPGSLIVEKGYPGTISGDGLPNIPPQTLPRHVH
ncbi:MAG: hypothetical protein Q9218_005705 [Villophora microphyllina]